MTNDLGHSSFVVRHCPAATIIALCSAIALLPAWAADETPVTTTVTVSRPTVAVFMQPALQSTHDPNAVKTRSLVRAALARARRCLGDDGAEYTLVFATRIVVRNRGQLDTFIVNETGPMIGALLAQPGSNPRVIYVSGTEALEKMLPFALEDYFGARC